MTGAAGLLDMAGRLRARVHVMGFDGLPRLVEECGAGHRNRQPRGGPGVASLVGLTPVSKRPGSDAYARLTRRRRMTMAAELEWNLMPPLAFANSHVVIAAAAEPAYVLTRARRSAVSFPIGPRGGSFRGRLIRPDPVGQQRLREVLACSGLGSALRLETYVQDAERGNDTELAELFRKAQADSRKGAALGRLLPRSRLA